MNSKDYDFPHGMVRDWGADVCATFISRCVIKEWLSGPQSGETMVTYDSQAGPRAKISATNRSK